MKLSWHYACLVPWRLSKLGIVMYACNINIQEMEAEGSEV